MTSVLGQSNRGIPRQGKLVTEYGGSQRADRGAGPQKVCKLEREREAMLDLRHETRKTRSTQVKTSTNCENMYE